MILLLNASNHLGGGGLQVALSFINECRNFSENKYIVVLNTDNEKLLDFSLFENFSNFSFRIVEYKNYLQLGRKLSVIEKEYTPDVVFSVFGPSYWKSKAPQVMGYAIPHYIYPESPFFKTVSFIEKAKIKIRKIIHLHLLKKEADAIICETQDAVDRIKKILKSPRKKYFCVSNTVSSYFQNFDGSENYKLPKKTDNEFRFLFVSKYYSHKNLELTPRIAYELKNRGIENIKFVLTLDIENFERIIPECLRDFILNVGFVKPEECPSLYSECDAIIQPSFLEVFSANYVEAMKMQKPILASDYSFAHTVCKDAALYFNPENLDDAVDKVLKIANDSLFREELVAKGNEVLKSIPTAKDRAKRYLEIIENMNKNTYTKIKVRVGSKLIINDALPLAA